MFVARSENTMRNARPKMREDDGTVIRNLVEVRAAARRAEVDRMNAALRARRAEFDHVMAENVRRFEDEVAKICGYIRHQAFATIVERAIRVFKISRVELFSDRRVKRIVDARQFVMYWACRRTTLSLPHIGRKLGGRDHTTVLHGKDAYVRKRAAMGRTLRKAR